MLWGDTWNMTPASDTSQSANDEQKDTAFDANAKALEKTKAVATNYSTLFQALGQIRQACTTRLQQCRRPPDEEKNQRAQKMKKAQAQEDTAAHKETRREANDATTKSTNTREKRHASGHTAATKQQCDARTPPCPPQLTSPH
ncbi:hypothetical protein, conserved in T. vivax [Trypanosoma vivax Y486]|uniref:Uncharacterized protein n=1 Tax=Trypanosoma vivax (strain Y486) TaxID=1055687 RepID=F9WPD7_TRYVY|nr:hypothetical protein, conserved in T. vivax [Trypanosoma vivax Y486]|eukprot:CCD19414.1 hypothetical protein, conserved in T. vivax [Trypanosoma vivax Y486]